MRPFSFENCQVRSTDNELSAEWSERCGDLLAIEIEHRWIVDGLRCNHISLHHELLSFESCGIPPALAVPHHAPGRPEHRSVLTTRRAKDVDGRTSPAMTLMLIYSKRRHPEVRASEPRTMRHVSRHPSRCRALRGSSDEVRGSL